MIEKKSKITLENVSLIYPVTTGYQKSLRNFILKKFFNERYANEIKFVKSLDNINLTIDDGDRIGLIGNNGSGKTTLLKVLAGIYPVHKGEVTISHTPYTLLDISMGLQPEATGIENMYLMSYLRGFKTSEIEKRINWMKDFSGLGDAIDRELRTYSSGMKVRVATAIGLSVEPKIILFDEFFGAGDKEFLIKTKIRIEEILKKSGIFVLASHNEKTVNDYCNRVIELKSGKIISDQRI